MQNSSNNKVWRKGMMQKLEREVIWRCCTMFLGFIYNFIYHLASFFLHIWTSSLVEQSHNNLCLKTNIKCVANLQKYFEWIFHYSNQFLKAKFINGWLLWSKYPYLGFQMTLIVWALTINHDWHQINIFQ